MYHTAITTKRIETTTTQTNIVKSIGALPTSLKPTTIKTTTNTTCSICDTALTRPVRKHLHFHTDSCDAHMLTFMHAISEFKNPSSGFNKLCVFILNLCLCLVFMRFHKTYITHQRTFSPVQPSHQFAVTATQLCKFSYRSFCYIGQSRYASNDSLGPSYQALRFALGLNVPAFTPMLVAPALRPTTMLEVPAHLTPKHDINSALLWPPAFIAFGPSYPHEPGPAAATTDQAAPTTNFILFPSCSFRPYRNGTFKSL